MNAPCFDLRSMREAILSADLDTRIEVDALLGAPWTEEIDAAWLDEKLHSLTPARLFAVAAALRGPSSSALSEKMDADGFDFLQTEAADTTFCGSHAPDTSLDGADFEEGEGWEDVWDEGAYGDGLPVFSLDHPACGCGGGGAYGGGSNRPCLDCGRTTVHICLSAGARGAA